MTSERMAASNRRNGVRSRGPRTAGGKAASSRNALQHGLSASLLDEPAICRKVEALARAIAGAGANAAQINQARVIAEAQLDLARIRGAKARAMDAHALEMSTSEGAIREGEIEEDNPLSETGGTQEIATPSSHEVLRQLLRIERYERSAILRRRRAMRAFLVLQTGK
jgi:hypothetical protein